MQTAIQDIRYGLRLLARQPGFTLVAVLTLALGIGATTMIFSVVYGVLLRPLQFNQPDRLVAVWETTPIPGVPLMYTSPTNFLDWERQTKTLENLTEYRFGEFNAVLSGEPERIEVVQASGNLFPLLGVPPALGRWFGPDDDRYGAPGVVVVSHQFWQWRLGGSTAALGQKLTLGNEAYTVIGVMPAAFKFPPPISIEGAAADTNNDVWMPLRFSPETQAERGSHHLFCLGRLRPGITVDQARAEVAGIGNRLAQQYQNTGWGITLLPLSEQVFGGVRTALTLLLTAVGLLLLIACANVANLLLARGAARQKEVSVRAALGAGRARLVRQLLTESLLLAVLGGLAGLALTVLVLPLLLRLGASSVPRLDEVTIDSAVVLFSIAISVMTAVMFGLIPALETGRLPLAAALKESAAASPGATRGTRLQRALIVGEVALSLMLLASAGLLFRSFLQLRAVPLGFQPEHVVSMAMNLPRHVYTQPAQRTQFYNELLARVSALPGVQSAAITDAAPLTGDRQGRDFGIDRRPSTDAEDHHTNVGFVSPGYFRTMGIRLLRGRELAGADSPDAPLAVVINRSLADSYFPNQDPVGRHLWIGERPQSLYRIVGVADNERFESVESQPHAMSYVAFAQHSRGWSMTLVIRTTQPLAALVPAVRAQLHTLDPTVPIYAMHTMEDVVSRAVAQPRLSAFLLVLFAVLALALAAVGIYGVISYAVSQRTREFAIRMAVGAQQQNILRMVLREAAWLAAAGLAIGLVASLWATRLLRSVLFGVGPRDLATFATVPLILAAVALLASYLPARRAVRVDPMAALRTE